MIDSAIIVAIAGSILGFLSFPISNIVDNLEGWENVGKFTMIFCISVAVFNIQGTYGHPVVLTISFFLGASLYYLLKRVF